LNIYIYAFSVMIYENHKGICVSKIKKKC